MLLRDRILRYTKVFWCNILGYFGAFQGSVSEQHFGKFLSVQMLYIGIFWGHLRVSVVVPGWWCISVSLWSILGVPRHFEILWGFSECLGTSQGFGAVF